MLEKIEVFGGIECTYIGPSVEKLMSELLSQYWKDYDNQIVTSGPFTISNDDPVYIPSDDFIVLNSDESVSTSSGTASPYWYHATENYWYNKPAKYKHYSIGGDTINTK